MKKKFMEPAMHRIELNLRENIAASGDGEESGGYLSVDFRSGSRCPVIDSQTLYMRDVAYMTDDELLRVVPNCVSYAWTTRRGLGLSVPLKELRNYIGY